jgi:anti-sigma factor RsiW
MTITRDVIKDLLTVHLAGEASRDTRTLIESWLRTDPELARQVALAGRSELPAAPAPPPSIEKQALNRTRRQLRWRTILLGTAIYVSTLPFTVAFDRTGLRGLLIEDWPERVVVIAAAIVLWGWYWRLSRRMRVVGL